MQDNEDNQSTSNCIEAIESNCLRKKGKLLYDNRSSLTFDSEVQIFSTKKYNVDNAFLIDSDHTDVEYRRDYNLKENKEGPFENEYKNSDSELGNDDRVQTKDVVKIYKTDISKSGGISIDSETQIQLKNSPLICEINRENIDKFIDSKMDDNIDLIATNELPRNSIQFSSIQFRIKRIQRVKNRTLLFTSAFIILSGCAVVTEIVLAANYLINNDIKFSILTFVFAVLPSSVVGCCGGRA